VQQLTVHRLDDIRTTASGDGYRTTLYHYTRPFLYRIRYAEIRTCSVPLNNLALNVNLRSIVVILEVHYIPKQRNF